MAKTVGIDPGANGAIAMVEGEQLTIHDMPTVTLGKKGKRRVDAAALASMLRALGPDHVWVEDVHAMPRNGAVSMFNFGIAFGLAHGVPLAMGIPVSMVSPASWKSAMRCSADKNVTRARASQLMPKHAHHWPLVKHDGRAEAALLALYGSTRGGVGKTFIEW